MRHPPPPLPHPWCVRHLVQVLQQLWDVQWLAGVPDRGGLLMALSTLFAFAACGDPFELAKAGVGRDAVVDSLGFDGHMTMAIATAASKLCASMYVG